MLIERLKPDFEFKNDTGLLIQLVHEGWKQVNVLYSSKNSKRGGHYHKICREAFYVIKGEFILTLEYKSKCEQYTFKEGDMFLISPFQKHTFDFIQDSIMVSMYDLGVEFSDGTKDIYNN